MNLNLARAGLMLLGTLALACSDEPGPDPADGSAPLDGADGTPEVPPAMSTLCAAPAGWVRLPYAVVAAAYSRSLERMVMVGDDQALHIFDPASCRDRRVPLARSGLSLSLHASGNEAVVGHDGRVSVVNLAPDAGAPAVVDVPVPVTHVAFDAKRRVHALAQANRSVSTSMHTVSLPDGSLRTGANLAAVGRLKMTPDGLGLFWVSDEGGSQGLSRVDPETGTPGPGANRFDSVQVCNDAFVTDDSKHVVTACGTVLRSLPGTPEDLTFQATLEGVARVRHLDSHAGSSRVVVIPGGDGFSAYTDADSVVRVHEGKFFNFIRTMPLPSFTAAAPALGNTAHGRYVFARGDGSRYHVIAAATTTTGDRAIHAVATLDAEGSQPVAPLPLPAESTGWLPPAVEPAQTVHPLAFDFADAAYSPSANRVLIASTQPEPALRYLDPETGQSEALPLPGAGRRVFMRPDGAVAAVVFDGGVRFVDVATRATIRDMARVPQNVSFGPPPRVLLDGDGQQLSWLALDTGTATPAGNIFGSGPFSLQATVSRPGFYMASERLRHYPDVNQVVSLYEGFDLRLFNDVHSISGRCGSRFWLLDGEKRLLLDCGRVFQLSEDARQDLGYLGSLDLVDRVRHGTYVQSLGRFVSIPNNLRIDGSFVASEALLVVHDPRTLGLETRIRLAQIPGDPFRSARGRFVFEAQGAKRVYVLADSESNPRPRALIVMDL